MHITLNQQTNQTKELSYPVIYQHAQSLVEGESDLNACLATLSALLKDSMNFFWVGFYVVKGGELVVGPYQGPLACTRIAFHRGVCGASYSQGKTIVVPDVEAFPGHIACSSSSKSEIVVPVFNRNGSVEMVLDVDSAELNTFDDVDAYWLEKITALITKKL